jgi:hypothetical protein
MIPMELLYLALAVGIGTLIYRYFTGRGGLQILRGDYAGLPPDGEAEVRQNHVRWTLAEGDSFAVAWQLADGHFVVMRVVFDAADEEEPDLGHIDLHIDRRQAVKGASWTEKIHDRTLRADVEAILKALMREAKVARSDKVRLAAAKPVGDDRVPPDRDQG